LALTVCLRCDYQIVTMQPFSSLLSRIVPMPPKALYRPTLLALLILTSRSPLTAGSRPGDALCVMTFNLRYASTNTPNAWSQRRPVMQTMLRKLSPDVFGTQEALYEQLKDLEVDLPSYAWIGLGREGGSHGEFGAVFYRKKRLDGVEFDHFWLSDTPDLIASTTWGNKNRRMVTWVKFRDRITRREFYVFNTHFDHEKELAREKSAELVRARLAGLTNDLPVLVIGDFNARGAASKSYDILTADGFLKDAWLSAATRRSESWDTFHDYAPPKVTGFRIDWILYRGPWAVDTAEVVTFSRQGKLPSDHFPVVAWMRLLH
jgi:endonuclease/exonuclease/phosphatase family metal-dependent hydrolase